MEFSSNPHIWLWNERNIMYDKAQIKKHKLMKITVFTAERQISKLAWYLDNEENKTTAN